MSWIDVMMGALKAFTTYKPPAKKKLSIDEKGWLEGENVVKMPAHPTWYYGLDSPDDEPIGVIWHYTATNYGTAKNMAKRRVRKRNPKKDRAASWHVTVDHKGKIWQSVPFKKGAWHCGKGRINGYRINKCTVGIELEGHGKDFTCEQVDAAEALIVALIEAYDMTEENLSHGHVDFDPKRRSDPGKIWSKQKLPTLLQKAKKKCT